MKRVTTKKTVSTSQDVSMEKETIGNCAYQESDVPVNAEDELNLIPMTTCYGQRYTGLFAEVWSSIPANERQTILDRWQIGGECD